MNSRTAPDIHAPVPRSTRLHSDRTVVRKPRLTLLVAGAACAGVLGCEEPRADRLALDPSGPLRFTAKGITEELKVAAFRGTMPFVKPIPTTWSSSDPTVATVDDKGLVTTAGSGRASVTASAWGLSTSAEVLVSIVGSVAVTSSVPRPLKLSAPPLVLEVLVKDDKGNVIEKPKVQYRATDYCVEVDDQGRVTPLADGECDVVVAAADKSARVHFEVRE